MTGEEQCRVPLRAPRNDPEETFITASVARVCRSHPYLEVFTSLSLVLTQPKRALHNRLQWISWHSQAHSQAHSQDAQRSYRGNFWHRSELQSTSSWAVFRFSCGQSTMTGKVFASPCSQIGTGHREPVDTQFTQNAHYQQVCAPSTHTHTPKRVPRVWLKLTVGDCAKGCASLREDKQEAG
ncbi:hypothetical protein WMY93_015114 [Mugilogobius chulae]|uniref:Uncharacterized protein n=1 Tax=Mugilogobius chulae TaxID=88201 RepID=A0AAW0P8L1_9GOBI